MKRYIKPSIHIYSVITPTILAGSDTIGFTDTKGDNTQAVLSKDNLLDFSAFDNDDE